MTTRTHVRGLSDCPGCGRLLRPKMKPATAYNEITARRYAARMCYGCYNSDVTASLRDRGGRPSDEQNRESLEAWVRSRGGSVDALGLPPIERQAS